LEVARKQGAMLVTEEKDIPAPKNDYRLIVHIKDINKL